jgi:FAD binding domain/Berberine and berberine like
MIDRKPAFICRCSAAAQVRAAIQFAKSERLPLSVRGGGHNIAGNAICEGGLMVDLSPMKQIAINPVSREAVAEPGVLWGEFDAATEAYGLATTGGQVSHTGIAGLTLGGGLGNLMSKFGAVCDNVLSLDVVTADGEMLTCSETQNTDLFWGMRGAGANFGVTTSFRYRLHPLGQVLGGLLLHPVERAKELFSFYRDFAKQSPDDLYSGIGFLRTPDGLPVVAVVAIYAGSLSAGEHVLGPLRTFGPPLADLIRPMAYTEAQKMLDDAVPIGNRYYWKSNFATEITDGLVDILAEGAADQPSSRSIVMMFRIGGAIRRVPREAMAFDQRNSDFEMSIIANWTDPAQDDQNIQWARQVWSKAQPFVSTSVYLNHLTADEPQARVVAAYGETKYQQLAKLKQKYDPDNLFCANHNIQPAT